MQTEEIFPIVSISAPVPFTLNPKTRMNLMECSEILNTPINTIMQEALEDWLNCVAPARMETLLFSQNEKKLVI